MKQMDATNRYRDDFNYFSLESNRWDFIWNCMDLRVIRPKKKSFNRKKS